ncbi:hypothetical protein T492DRAFT_1075979, partial [Pavlovales sp. CCMP2436]
MKAILVAAMLVAACAAGGDAPPHVCTHTLPACRCLMRERFYTGAALSKAVLTTSQAVEQCKANCTCGGFDYDEQTDGEFGLAGTYLVIFRGYDDEPLIWRRHSVAFGEAAACTSQPTAVAAPELSAERPAHSGRQLSSVAASAGPGQRAAHGARASLDAGLVDLASHAEEHTERRRVAFAAYAAAAATSSAERAERKRANDERKATAHTGRNWTDESQHGRTHEVVVNRTHSAREHNRTHSARERGAVRQSGWPSRESGRAARESGDASYNEAAESMQLHFLGCYSLRPEPPGGEQAEAAERLRAVFGPGIPAGLRAVPECAEHCHGGHAFLIEGGECACASSQKTASLSLMQQLLVSPARCACDTETPPRCPDRGATGYGAIYRSAGKQAGPMLMSARQQQQPMASASFGAASAGSLYLAASALLALLALSAALAAVLVSGGVQRRPARPVVEEIWMTDSRKKLSVGRRPSVAPCGGAATASNIL